MWRERTRAWKSRKYSSAATHGSPVCWELAGEKTGRDHGTAPIHFTSMQGGDMILERHDFVSLE